MKFINIKNIVVLLTVLTNNAHANVSDYLLSIKNKPARLYAFLKEMPKGGELHYHFTGSAYPEDLIAVTRDSNLYLSPKTYAISIKPEQNTILSRDFFKKSENYLPAIKAWSMQDLISNYKDRHDHFFGVFFKIYPVYNIFYQKLLAKMLVRAASQNEIYMEIMLNSLENANDFKSILQTHSNLQIKQQILLKNFEFNHRVNKLIEDSERYLLETRRYLKCNNSKSSSKACNVLVRLQAIVLRESEENVFFAQALAAFLAAHQSKYIVGVNIVQPENGNIALKDFNKQMHIFRFLHEKYPDVRVAMHAGELDPKTSSLKNLRNHINDSVFIANAERIGHGTDICYEKNKKNLLKYLAQKHIPVEINLTSNELILGVDNTTHPLNYYLKSQVPVVLSTDDEGILQTDLTTQYVNAVVKYKLDYQTLKLINRNALTYSFIDGQSIWADSQAGILVAQCQSLKSQACKNFIKHNLKAKMQWQLEVSLIKFENKFNN